MSERLEDNVVEPRLKTWARVGVVGLLFGVIGGLVGRAGGFDPFVITAAAGFLAGIVATLLVLSARRE